MLSPFTKTLIFKSVLSLCHAQYTINPTQVLEVTISREGMTRITVEGDGVEDIFAYPSQYSDNIQKHPAGHVFIVGEGISGPLYLTIITRSGLTQDLRLSVKSGKPEPLILKGKKSGEAVHASESIVINAIKTLFSGQIPNNFSVVSTQESSRSREGIEAIATKSYQSNDYFITEFTVKNTSRNLKRLNPQLMWDSQDYAVIFADESLDASGETKMYVVQKL
ncbi:MAG: type-F conjugative transfer system secretin TraK [Candidatus Paracaedibacteraceae bacterium]|nr:type-F conjugative transfer system secretin TraK [Candidatus Paracaedibacteraceae bacterium]